MIPATVSTSLNSAGSVSIAWRAASRLPNPAVEPDDDVKVTLVEVVGTPVTTCWIALVEPVPIVVSRFEAKVLTAETVVASIAAMSLLIVVCWSVVGGVEAAAWSVLSCAAPAWTPPK